MFRSILAFLTIAVFLLPGNSPLAGKAATFTVIGAGAEQLREDFNRAKGSVRLLFVVDPVCPGCLRGLDDVNEALLSKTDDPRLQVFVVHVPVIGAEAEDIGPAAALLQSTQVRHYWNPDGSFGRELADAVALEVDGKPVYAWDVWLIYGPEATWTGALPPRPAHLMHQLYALQDSETFSQLDREVFARDVHQLLARLPPPAVSGQ